MNIYMHINYLDRIVFQILISKLVELNGCWFYVLVEKLNPTEKNKSMQVVRWRLTKQNIKQWSNL